MRKFEMQTKVAELSAETIQSFAKDVLDGKVDHYLKSQDIPESNDKSVKVVVGKTFKEMVLDSNKAVFLKYYAPWCGHCKKLAPVWEKVADNLVNSDVEIAIFDATANEAENQWAVKSYPTLVYYPRGADKAGVKYDGKRDEASILQWLQEKGHGSSHKDEL